MDGIRIVYLDSDGREVKRPWRIDRKKPLVLEEQLPAGTPTCANCGVPKSAHLLMAHIDCPAWRDRGCMRCGLTEKQHDTPAADGCAGWESYDVAFPPKVYA